MNLTELKAIIDFHIDNKNNYQEPNEIQVVVTTKDSSIGERACVKVASVGLGFDWERGQFRIEPSTPVVKSPDSRSIPRGTMRKTFGGIEFTACPTCGLRVAKNDTYCRHCGQRLR